MQIPIKSRINLFFLLLENNNKFLNVIKEIKKMGKEKNENKGKSPSNPTQTQNVNETKLESYISPSGKSGETLPQKKGKEEIPETLNFHSSFNSCFL